MGVRYIKKLYVQIPAGPAAGGSGWIPSGTGTWIPSGYIRPYGIIRKSFFMLYHVEKTLFYILLFCFPSLYTIRKKNFLLKSIDKNLFLCL